MGCHVRSELRRIPRLQENGSGALEFTHKTFASAEIANDATTGNPFEHVVAIPRNEMAVVDDVFLAITQLCKVSLLWQGLVQLGGQTHIFPDDGTHALDPDNAHATNLVDE